MSHTLFYDCRDEAVSIFKGWLNEVLIPSPHLNSDDRFCEQTVNAVVRFQMQNNILSALGFIDPQTAEQLLQQVKKARKKKPRKVAKPKRRNRKVQQMIEKAVPQLPASGELTLEALAWIAPNLMKNKIPAAPQDVVDAINFAMREANVNTPTQKAAFLSQTIQESDGLNTTTEYADGSDYEKKLKLRNTEPGDGKRFKGRGFIQLTGRENYTDAWLDLGFSVKKDASTKHLWRKVDPIKPEAAANLREAALVTAWFWNKKGLNALADALQTAPKEEDQFLAVSIRVNGKHKSGYPNGWADRKIYYRKAKKLYGIEWGTMH